MDCLFILGSPRSGTTFLASLLEFTKYGAPFETQFIVKYDKKLVSYGDLNDFSNFSRLVTDIINERAISQWNATFDIGYMFKKLATNRSYSAIVNEICLTLMEGKNKYCWGDKTPQYILNLKSIIKHFPTAKFIYIVRDGRDVAHSILQKPWGPYNIYTCARRWVQANGKTNLKLLHELEKKGNLISVKYEELLTDIDGECSKIYQFLGHPELTDSPMLAKLKSSVKGDNFYKWKQTLSPSQINTYNSTAKHTLNLHNYECPNATSKISLTTKVWYKLHNTFCLARHLFYTNVTEAFQIKYKGKQPFNE